MKLSEQMRQRAVDLNRMADVQARKEQLELLYTDDFYESVLNFARDSRFETRRTFERTLRIVCCCTNRFSKKATWALRPLVESGLPLPSVEVFKECLWKTDEKEREITLDDNWGAESTSTLKVTKVECIMCGNTLKADGVSKWGRRHLHFRLCAGRCWNYARGYAADLARKKKISGEAAFNLMLSKLLRRNCNEPSQTNNGRIARSAV